ncbi:4-oxalomesaconate tautomerase [Melaminivora sp.]|uniref:4-oxalomesaconate tautomerase n=1 Tax=Melaminivora sp. TaxID=1933032 RepID=UPI0028AF537D|nr:4-oxalomesaconate tautomerase [Melaminivora sp.]
MPQTAISCMLLRGGTSKGPFFRAEDLPRDAATRDCVLLAALGSPHARQIDGVGGAHPLTSKVGIVDRSDRPGVDLEFLFAQLQPEKSTVDTTPNCGNMLAAVVPFALESGLVRAQGETSTFRVLTLNTGMAADITVQTPGGHVEYEGTARIDGVPGTGAPVDIAFLDTAGSVCASLLPTGRARDTVTVQAEGLASFSLDVTCIDNGMPLVLFRASDMGVSGLESAAELNANASLKRRIEALRLQAAQLMGLGDVSAKNYPKMTLIAPPQHGGAITTRSFIPHVCHDAIGVLAAVTVGTALRLPGTVCEGVARLPADADSSSASCTLSVEHPTGEFSVTLQTDPADPGVVTRAALLRTARLLMRGEVLVPASVWGGA